MTRVGGGVLALRFPMTSDPWGVVCCACWPGLPGAGFRSRGGLVVSLRGLLVAGVLMMPTVWSLQVMWWAALVMLVSESATGDAVGDCATGDADGADGASEATILCRR